jgi:hypothetical protein
MWWSKPKTAPSAVPVQRVEHLEGEVLKLQRTLTEIRLELVAVEDKVLRWMRRSVRGPSADGASGSGNNQSVEDLASSAPPPSEAMRQVAIRRGNYGVPTRLSSTGGNGDSG